MSSYPWFCLGTRQRDVFCLAGEPLRRIAVELGAMGQSCGVDRVAMLLSYVSTRRQTGTGMQL